MEKQQFVVPAGKTPTARAWSPSNYIWKEIKSETGSGGRSRELKLAFDVLCRHEGGSCRYLPPDDRAVFSSRPKGPPQVDYGISFRRYSALYKTGTAPDVFWIFENTWDDYSLLALPDDISQLSILPDLTFDALVERIPASWREVMASASAHVRTVVSLSILLFWCLINPHDES
jgi:hypothetical protein